MADSILPSLPSEHFSDGGKHYRCSVVADYDDCASRWLELDLQRRHLFIGAIGRTVTPRMMCVLNEAQKAAFSKSVR